MPPVFDGFAVCKDKTGGTEGLGMGLGFDDMKGLLDIVNGG